MTQFSDLKLDPKVLKAIDEAGYTTPTPIQAGAIPPALEGRDVLGIAQTGTGKTAGFTLPMITLLGRGRARARMPRSLVLCPTRELAAQVAENFDTYAKHTRLTKALLIGGVSFGEQDKLIDRGVDVLIATPGRLLDHFERGKLLLTGVQIMVVDEADRMLDMGFIPDIERIFQLTPFTRQTLFFSATMAPEIERITDTFLHSPERIEVARQATASETITQKLIEFTPTRKDQTAKQKRELLRAVIDDEGERLKNAIIFCNRKTEVDIVAKSLKAHGYDAAPIHGDLEQRVRMATLDGFREGTLRFLVASDVAARGLDIPAVSHVFNFDLPSHAEDYVHRIGRTGRAGREGTAISLGVPADEKYLAAIETLLKQTLPRAAAPEGFSLSEAAKAAPVPRDEGRNGRSRSRGGRGRGRGEAPRGAAGRNPAPEREAAAEAPRAAAPEPRREEARSPAREERREDRRDERGEGRREERRGEQRDDRRNGRSEERREERRDDRRDRGRDERRGGGPQVTGFGDLVPEFVTRSFRLSESPAATVAVAAPPAAAKPAETRAPRAERPAESRRPARPRPEPAAAPAEAAEITAVEVTEAVAGATPLPTPVPDAPAEALPVEAMATDAPLAAEPTPEPTAEMAAAEVSGDAAAEAAPDAKAAPAKPARRRTSRSKATATAEAPATDAAPDAAPAEAAAKPAPRRRSTRAKATAEPPSAAGSAEPGSPPAAEPKPASRRRTRKPAAEAGSASPGEAPAIAAAPDTLAGL